MNTQETAALFFLFPFPELDPPFRLPDHTSWSRAPPADTRRLINVDLTLVHRPRRRTSVKSTLIQRRNSVRWGPCSVRHRILYV